MNILITGHSRGIGAALCDYYLARGERVFGLSRTPAADPRASLHQVAVDLASAESIPAALDALLASPAELSVVYLNAGVLGPVAAMRETTLATLQQVMDINLWANKVILDWLVDRVPAPRQIILLSSGAAVRGHYGWGAYALSKAALNMLTQLYAHEMPDTHLCALAPGLVDTDMQVALRNCSADAFPSLARLHAAKDTPSMATPAAAAARIATHAAALQSVASGSFVDLRELASA